MMGCHFPVTLELYLCFLLQFEAGNSTQQRKTQINKSKIKHACKKVCRCPVFSIKCQQKFKKIDPFRATDTQIDINKNIESQHAAVHDTLTLINTCDVVKTCLMKDSGEHFKPNNGINNNDKQDEQSNVKQRNHRHQNCVYDNLQA